MDNINTTTNSAVFDAENNHLATHDPNLPYDLMCAMPPGTPLTIHCEHRSWLVHREALCHRSKYFDLACNGPFQEATQNSITLHDDSPSAVHDMLTYLMYASYGPAFVFSAVETHIAACDIADKYMLPGLQALAVAGFKKCLWEMWAKGTAYDSTGEFAGVVERVYEDPRGLWEDPLKEALRLVAVLRLVQMLPVCWQKEKDEYGAPGEWLAQWGEVAGSRVEPEAPRFLADFWGSNSKLYGWWFKGGFPGTTFFKGWEGNGEEGKGRVSRWVYDL